jgi:hypothetical protein
MRWDETWHRLREWTKGQGPSERLAAQILLSEGYCSVDPTHPLGGRDGGKDALCHKNGTKYVMAVYFPRGKKSFATVERKFRSDLKGVRMNKSDALVFVTNQELTDGARKKLVTAAGKVPVELYHLDRLTTILDQPRMQAVRKQFLDMGDDEALLSLGGKGGERPGAGGGGGGVYGPGRAGDGGRGGDIRLYGLPAAAPGANEQEHAAQPSKAHPAESLARDMYPTSADAASRAERLVEDVDLDGRPATAPGAGGGGAGAFGPDAVAGGGGDGGEVVAAIIDVEPGKAYRINIGHGGRGGRPGEDGKDGGDTSFGDLLVAKGGKGGRRAHSRAVAPGPRLATAEDVRAGLRASILFAECVHIRDGLAFVLAGGWERYSVASVPAERVWPFLLSIESGVAAPPGELLLGVQLRNPDGALATNGGFVVSRAARTWNLHGGLAVTVTTPGPWSARVVSGDIVLAERQVDVVIG